MAPHCLVCTGILHCSHATHWQPHPGCSSPCFNLHTSHRLNNSRAPGFTSRSSLQAVLTVGYSGLLCCLEWKSGSSSPSVCPLRLWTPTIHCSIMTSFSPLYPAHLPTLQPPSCLWGCVQAAGTAFHPAKQRYNMEGKKTYHSHIRVWKYGEYPDNLLLVPLTIWPGISLRRSQDCSLGT